MSKHSPLPWRLDAQTSIRAYPETLSAPIFSPFSVGDEEVLANKEFIIHACNNHYKLIESLKKSERDLMDAHKYMGRGYMGKETELFERLHDHRLEISKLIMEATNDTNR